MSLIGTLAVNIVANTAAIEQGLNKVSGKVSAFSQSLNSIGLGGAYQAFQGISNSLTSIMGELAPVIAAFEAVSAAIADGAKKAGDLADRAEQVGVSAQEMAGMESAAAKSGGKVEALQSAMHKLNEQLGQVRARNQEVIASLKAQGLEPYQLAAGNTADALRQIADRAAQIQNPMERAAFMTAVFGKSGRELGPMFAQGAAGIDKMIARSRELGVVLQQQTYEAADAADKLQKEVEQSAEARNIRMAASTPGQWWTQGTAEMQKVFNQAVGDLFEGGTENGIVKMRRLAKEAEDMQRRVEEVKKAGDQMELESQAAALQEEKQQRMAKHLDDLTKKAEKLTEAVKKPEEIYQQTIKDLEEMNKLGLISQEIRDRGAKQAAEVRDRALKVDDKKSQADLTSKAAGSQEAFAAWARQQNFMGGFKGDENGKKIEKNTGAAVKELEAMRAGIDEMKAKPAMTLKVVKL